MSPATVATTAPTCAIVILCCTYLWRDQVQITCYNQAWKERSLQRGWSYGTGLICYSRMGRVQGCQIGPYFPPNLPTLAAVAAAAQKYK